MTTPWAYGLMVGDHDDGATTEGETMDNTVYTETMLDAIKAIRAILDGDAGHICQRCAGELLRGHAARIAQGGTP